MGFFLQGTMAYIRVRNESIKLEDDVLTELATAAVADR